jgi:hypothetical protein
LRRAEQNHRMVVRDDDFYSLAHLILPEMDRLDAARICIELLIFSFNIVKIRTVKGTFISAQLHCTHRAIG